MAKQSAAQTSPYKFQYAVKFICTSDIPGTSQQSPGLLPGNYQTAVNIHNPNQTAARIRKKLAMPNLISKWLESGLKYDEVEQVNCPDIDKFELQLIHGFEGFLVIESTQSLDVVAVYTAAPLSGQVSSIDVEQINERRL